MAIDFSGWSRRFMSDGVVLYPPAGRSVGLLRVQDRVRPLVAMKTLVDQVVAAWKGLLEAPTVGPLERLTTLDGEYAAVVTLATRSVADGRPVERSLGMVFAEDHYSKVDAVIQDPAQFELFRDKVRGVVQHLSLGLGWQRRRRYLYTPPPGWYGVARPYSAEWYPPGYPRDDGAISVFHAKPIAAVPSQAFERMLREDLGGGFAEEGADEPVPIPNDHGLDGQITVRSGVYLGQGRRHFHLAVLQDHRFLYLVRLETGDSRRNEHAAELEALVKSVRPLPLLQTESEQGAVTHWLA
jgi:hypothetical protein